MASKARRNHAVAVPLLKSPLLDMEKKGVGESGGGFVILGPIPRPKSKRGTRKPRVRLTGIDYDMV